MFDQEYATLIAEAPTLAAPAIAWQGTLFGHGQPGVDAAFSTLRRRELGEGSWLDMAPGWLAGADELLGELRDRVSWRCPEITMYDRRLAQPRLSAWYELEGGVLPAPIDLPAIHSMLGTLAEHYGPIFDSVGLNLYRSGEDSVAWHSDRHARRQRNPVVAIVTLGSPRPFLLRPKDGGRSLRVVPHAGDLVTMGGACQHRWEHCVPKVRAAGPRLSITFRQGSRSTTGSPTATSPAARTVA